MRRWGREQIFDNVARLGRKVAADEAGSPAVEFALVFPIFVGVVLATLQAATIFLVKAYFDPGRNRRQGSF